jgi:hypothetical protein
MKTLLILSSGRDVWDEVEKVRPIIGEHDTLAINYMIILWPDKLDYAVSWHHDLLPRIVDVRTYRNKKNRPVTIGPKPFEGVDRVGRFYDGDIESSGMYAVHVGAHLGYDKIIITGVPFDCAGHFYDPAEEHDLFKNCATINDKHRYVDTAKNMWKKMAKEYGDRVRAVSGNLADCFGKVTEEWMAS